MQEVVEEDRVMFRQKEKNKNSTNPMLEIGHSVGPFVINRMFGEILLAFSSQLSIILIWDLCGLNNSKLNWKCVESSNFAQNGVKYIYVYTGSDLNLTS